MSLTEPRSIHQPCEDAGKASVEDGVVLLDGPDGVAVAMTAEAAILTGESLIAAAREVFAKRVKERR